MPRAIEGQDRQQVTLTPKCHDDFIADNNLVRVIDAFAGEPDLTKPGFDPCVTGFPHRLDPKLLKAPPSSHRIRRELLAKLLRSQYTAPNWRGR
jgi:hypothetical protein